MDTQKRLLIGFSFAFLCLAIFFLGVRGLAGNPDIETLNSSRWSLDGPLELSPERGRYALLYSVIEDHSLIFSVSVARLALPDLGINSAGEYVSLFAPGVSFLVMPGYFLGKLFGAAQVGTYLVISLFALANIFLIKSVASRLGAGYFSSLLAGLTFGFATPAFAYGVNLYQHHVSTTIMLVALYCLLRFRHPLSFALIWFLCSLSVVVDNPNLFLMLPIGLYALILLWQSLNWGDVLSPRLLKRRIGYGATFLMLLVPMVFFMWYNHSAYGDPFQLPGTLKGVDEIGPDGRPAEISTYDQAAGLLKQQNSGKTSHEKSAVGFFQTRDLYNGFYTHFISPDRGIIFFTPIILLGVFGLGYLYRKNSVFVALIVATIGMNVLTYSMWGDPQGGWAFGSRYLVPTYALLAIGIALFLSRMSWRWFSMALFLALFTYSAFVNTLGAVTTSANPIKDEVLVLEKQSGHEEKYTFVRNWEYLNEKYSHIGSKSFVYQTWVKPYLSAVQYFVFLYGLVLLMALGAVIGWFREDVSDKQHNEMHI